eukprot:CAMPEP_0196142818 /NCGR_PEP_ID=MMETSP0910-20130528/12371_1 /TAXON_ID=49265 /ORGANISM="Thalassiosira rotula, Strain GSO102" /LENGTH=286 /DNA_ID=CAMNT_0041404185 /DNA_START=52 /DNA_END=912 /DNA_ORIENTATION=+
MTSLRKKSSNGPNPEVDVEAPKIDDTPKAFPALAARPTVSSIITKSSQNCSMKQMISDAINGIISGLVIALFVIPILIYLDHRKIIHYQNAHNIRDSRMRELGNSNTRAYVEEILNVKLMMMDEYESQSKKLKEAVETIAANHEKMKDATDKLMANEEEMPGVAEKFLALASDPRLELDKFCGPCPWDSVATCDERVQYLQDKKKMKLIPAKVSAIMESPTCKQNEEYNALMNNPLLGLDKYCGACPWDQKTTCDGRVEFLQRSRNIGPLQARISAMEILTCKIHK